MREQTWITYKIGIRELMRQAFLGLSFCFLSLMLCPLSGWAAVSGTCSDCHTMHNSQDGSSVFAGGPQEALLNNDCVGCHTGQNTSSSTTPYVFNASPTPIYGATGTEGDTLAAGSFYWVSLANGLNNPDNAKGHNVAGLTYPDADLTSPPGFGTGLAAADGSTVGNGSWPAGTQPTCAGIYGCHGTHDQVSATQAIKGGHHMGASGAVVTGSPPTAANSYRMLVGIAGYEDSDWEFQPDAFNHNQYKGVDAPSGSDSSTISYLCAQCHGAFHQSTGTGSPWLRHPTDFDLANATRAEYDLYNGGTGTDNVYSVVTPVASASVASVLSVVTPATTDDDTIVTCISCHRAHGTPYYKLMRWDYANSIGGACANCHTSKS